MSYPVHSTVQPKEDVIDHKHTFKCHFGYWHHLTALELCLFLKLCTDPKGIKGPFPLVHYWQTP